MSYWFLIICGPVACILFCSRHDFSVLCIVTAELVKRHRIQCFYTVCWVIQVIRLVSVDAKGTLSEQVGVENQRVSQLTQESEKCKTTMLFGILSWLRVILSVCVRVADHYGWQASFCGQDKLFYRHTIKTYTHTRLTALCLGLFRWASTRKVKPIWILLKQETVSGCGISWAICKSTHSSVQITTPAPHQSVFLQAGCPSRHPTNSVKALKELHKNIHLAHKWCAL